MQGHIWYPLDPRTGGQFVAKNDRYLRSCGRGGLRPELVGFVNALRLRSTSDTPNVPKFGCGKLQGCNSALERTVWMSPQRLRIRSSSHWASHRLRPGIPPRIPPGRSDNEWMEHVHHPTGAIALPVCSRGMPARGSSSHPDAGCRLHHRLGGIRALST